MSAACAMPEDNMSPGVQQATCCCALQQPLEHQASGPKSKSLRSEHHDRDSTCLPRLGLLYGRDRHHGHQVCASPGLRKQEVGSDCDFISECPCFTISAKSASRFQCSSNCRDSPRFKGTPGKTLVVRGIDWALFEGPFCVHAIAQLKSAADPLGTQFEEIYLGRCMVPSRPSVGSCAYPEVVAEFSLVSARLLSRLADAAFVVIIKHGGSGLPSGLRFTCTVDGVPAKVASKGGMDQDTPGHMSKADLENIACAVGRDACVIC